MKKVQSTCNYCAIDCNLDFYVENNRVVKVVPTPGYPVNNGFSCIKGLSLDKQQTTVKPNSLPKIRQEDGSFKEVSWDDGFTYVANKLKEIQEKYGQESVAGISTGQLTMEEFSLFGHVMRNYLKTNVDGNTRLCMATAVVAHKQSYGFDAPGYTLEDLELSDTIIFIGSNPVVAHPILWGRVRQNKVPNHKVIVIDPRKSETAMNADYWYGLKWKSDLLLLYTIANQLIEKDYLDHKFIAENTEKFEDFKEFVKSYTLERGVEGTGLSKEQILELVELIHNGKKVSFWWTMGVNQGYEAVRTAQAIINLALMTGNIGKPGTGANSITGQCNAMGSRAFSNTAVFFGGGDFTNPARRTRIAQVLGVDESMLAEKPTKTYNQIIEGINAGEIKGLWILCTNPRHSWTNNETFASATKKLELFVVQDIYYTIESAEDCTVYFPVVPGLKKEGTYINLERRLSPMRPVLERGENEISDYEAILGVGKALGMGDALKGWETPKDCFNLMRECSRNMPCDFTGVTWEGLENSHGFQWPYPAGKEEENKAEQRRLYTDGKFFTPSKKAQFVFEEVRQNPLPTTKEFPYILNTGRGSVGQWHTQSRTKEVKFVEDVSSKKAYLFMNTKMAQENGIKEMDQICVYSVNGQNAVFAVKITDNVQYGELYALTLSNVYSGMGYPWIRHITMWVATIILLLYIIKIVKFPSVCKKEYETVVPCSLYAAFTMILMILGSYYFDFIPAFGKGIWAVAIVIHAIHILIFTYRNVIKKRDINTFVPSWFVTYNGIMVSCVVGGAMNAAGILKYIVYYGIIIYFIIIPIMIWRLIKVEVKAPVYHTMAVVLAPCSLCVVSYLNAIPNPNQVLLYILYACVLASVAFIIIKLPKFFAFSFAPGFAGMTFPMAIGIVASTKMAGYLNGIGNTSMANIVTQISGFQIYLTSMIIGYVLLNFVIMALKVERK